jgi:DNA-binding MarR family transcriptional regulator
LEFTKHNIELALSAVAKFEEALVRLTGDPHMPMQQLRLLLCLYSNGETAQQNLPELTLVEKSAVSRNVQKLGPGTYATVDGKKTFQPGLGLVEAHRPPENQRISLVRLTTKGRAVLEEAARQALQSRSV